MQKVCDAEIEKNTLPKQILQKIKSSGTNDFAEILDSFSKEAGVYGFGDLQVKRILETL